MRSWIGSENTATSGELVEKIDFFKKKALPLKERLSLIQIEKLFLFLVNGVTFQIRIILLLLNPFGL